MTRRRRLGPTETTFIGGPPRTLPPPKPEPAPPTLVPDPDPDPDNNPDGDNNGDNVVTSAPAKKRKRR